jgi:hypothetical protein
MRVERRGKEGVVCLILILILIAALIIGQRIIDTGAGAVNGDDGNWIPRRMRVS